MSYLTIRKLQAILILFGSLLLTPPAPFRGESATKKVNSLEEYEEPDAYELLSVVLDNEADLQKLGRIKIYRRATVVPELALCNQIPEDFRSAADDLAKKTKPRLQFKKQFSLKHPYSLSDSQGVNDFALSAVGFDATRTHAVVSVGQWCGFMCSGGWTYLFRKLDNRWQLVRKVCEVVS